MESIIIDGVNVAECKHFDDGDCLNPAETVLSCESQTDCLFKQLQRAKAEKQDLINYYELREGGMLEDIQYWNNKAQELNKKFEEYKKSKQASYESMQKEWNFAINTLRDVEAENERLEANKKIVLKNGKTISKMCSKYRQALEDIRENLNNSCWESADIGIRNRILTKINEVLN